ncbi:MAG: tetratricopeptide repeat protein [Bacteroidia bacterium]
MNKKPLFCFRKKTIAILIVLINSCFVYSQITSTDSLLKALKKIPEDTIKVNILNSLSRVYLVDSNDFEKGRMYANKALVLSQSLNYKKGIAHSYINYGTFYLRKANYPFALEHYNKGVKICKEINDQSGIAKAYTSIGFLYNLQGNYDAAIQMQFKVLEIKKALGQKLGLAMSYNNLAISYSSQAKYPEAFTYFLKSLEIDVNDNLNNCMVYNNIGYMFSLQQKTSEALFYYLKALELALKIGNKVSITLININIGGMYYLQKLYKESLKYYLKGLELSLQTGEKTNTALAYSGIGSVYVAQKNYSEAINYLLKALQIQKIIGDKEGAVNTNITIGTVYENQVNFGKAIEYYSDALNASISIGLKEGTKNAYKNLASVYTKAEDYKKALNFNNLYYEEKDSILNKESIKQIAELNTKYKTEKKEKEIELLLKDQELNEKNAKEQRIIRLALIIGIATLVILLFLVYQRYRFKQKANLLLEKQKNEIIQQNKLITDSIDYAKNIQDAVLPTEIQVKDLLPQSFILFKPKAIVSGDFYWIAEKNNTIICIVADCTGHGVPGAFMSMLGINMLDNITNREKPIAANILNALNSAIVAKLSNSNQSEPSLKHGMEMSILIIDKINMRAQYAGAHNPLYFIRKGEMTEIKADKTTIGSINNTEHSLFTNHFFDIQKEDVFYLFTDGFPDQKGGPNKKKFYYAPFKELLLSIHHLNLNEQKVALDRTIATWAGDIEQIDDILIMGIEI